VPELPDEPAPPEDPVLATATGAEQLAVPPPLEPWQDHVHGPLPVNAETPPVAQRLVLGADDTATPFALPQLPATSNGAKHDAVWPPLLPAQDHFQGPLPETDVADPEAHNSVAGTDVAPTPLAPPHAPATSNGAEHEAVWPSPVPVQDHVHGPLPETDVAEPPAQRPRVGAAVAPAPSAAPHWPSSPADPDPPRFVKISCGIDSSISSE
jgi:hypothetical protein